MIGMGERMQAAGGCLTAAVGAGAGLAVWSVGVDGRLRRFEQSPDWSVLYAELPLMVLGGTATALGLWALIHRVLVRRVRSRR
ncbi:hypothetical protein [Streptomyces acidicola]|uniref:Uncharacterized protein n=1 Tax=Streptomyces acidicola TaxID=2596892 RepID=A0A5N8X1P7_9ACTN|nr:hypothetical protein [Streptomyces acidicola]MPY53531.1 hypothetical protein [Streptomyces acidicola]